MRNMRTNTLAGMGAVLAAALSATALTPLPASADAVLSGTIKSAAGEALGGDEELMREYISNGTPRMPGFRFNFEPEQIGAIVAYLKTVPPAAPAAAK